VKRYAEEDSRIKYFFKENAGPAAARNKALAISTADICVFTDGDCIPRKDWIHELVTPLLQDNVEASAGAYETLNTDSVLARFIGLEIAWKYRNQREIAAHGAYNLAVRKRLLMELGGFDEAYRYPSGEDWDLAYKISKRHKIIFVPTAIVGHYHCEKFFPYMRNQIRRSADRIKLYYNHPYRIRGDNYTPRYVALQILGAGLFFPALLLVIPFFHFSFLVPLSILAFLALSTMVPFFYLFRRDAFAAIYGLPVQFCRCFAWTFGCVIGLTRLMRRNKNV